MRGRRSYSPAYEEEMSQDVIYVVVQTISPVMTPDFGSWHAAKSPDLCSCKKGAAYPRGHFGEPILAISHWFAAGATCPLATEDRNGETAAILQIFEHPHELRRRTEPPGGQQGVNSVEPCPGFRGRANELMMVTPAIE